MIEVYRLETKEGKGIYSGGLGYLLQSSEHYTYTYHPCWYEDAILKEMFPIQLPERPTPTYHFGFGNVEQLNNWLQGVDLNLLSDNEVSINKYQIAHGTTKDGLSMFINGHNQCLFLKEDATLVNTYSPLILLNQDFI